jgi:glutamyl-tRNA synthetase
MSCSGTETRVRFAPSPTGYPHLGNIRTALFNWLFARHHGGKFILRIEDTDAARKVEGAVEAIIDSLKWLGLDWDEGPYFQSQRLPHYQEIARKLVDQKNAYLCYCTPQRLEAMRQEQARRKQPPKYDRHCRELTGEEKAKLEASGVTPVVRFRTPLEGETSIDDLIRGKVTFQNDTLDDFVLLKSDGYPTYHLANIVDDHLMAISHVLRADEWLSSTPRHILLYRALDWPPPQFAHLPMILGEDRAKLSKRHGAATITDYQKQGYLPEAMLNFLSLLGWSLDDKTELLSREELIKHFTLERVSKTAAIFNKQKLEWMNGVYLRRLTPEQFSARAVPFLERDLPPGVKRPLDKDYIAGITLLIQERARTLAEVPTLADFFFLGELEYDQSTLIKGMDAATAAGAIKMSLERLQALETWDDASLENLLRPLAAELGLSTGKFFGLLRVAITGRTASPPLFQTIRVLGKKRCLDRLTQAGEKINPS